MRLGFRIWKTPPSMSGSLKDVQFKELDNAVWPSGCEASKHMDEVEAEEQPEPFSVSDVHYSAFMKDGKVLDTSEGADPSSLANKVARSAPAPASLGIVQELAKETGSSHEQNQAQNGLEDALKRRLQKLIDSNRVMLFMKGTPEEPKCEFSRMAVTLLKYYEVEFGSFDLLTDNEVMEGIQKYSNWPHLPQIYFEGRARGFRHIETLMKGCPSECSKDAFE
ncbi:monothiol glutaredoxin-S17-like [Prunus avium]|uniref:Monothiol glutaredoxin-S17-like n=1 Tax=Prunus avium TaxID=42229 RepID=A0A6P5TF15_PRUAV|nr:monothiol glutaredoxin-S17-like [Prunus avium]